MINISNEFKQNIENDNRNYLEYLEITLKEGAVLELTNEDIWDSEFKIDDGVTQSNEFTIGSCIINKLTVTLNNIYDDFSEYDFDGAIVKAQIGMELSGGRIEKIRKGIYTVDEANYNGSTIALECLDNMSKFDKPYSLSKLQYPATTGQIVRDACEVCGVLLGSATFENDDYVVKERPADEALTFRQVLLWIGQISCKWWKCNASGELVCGWYDTSVFESEQPDPDKYHHISSLSSQNICTDDVVITGVKVTEYREGEVEIFQSGEEGYILSIEKNKFIQEGDGANIASYLGTKLNGLRFRPLSVSCLSDPSIEAGDCAIVTDRKQNNYKCFVTNTTFTVGNYQQISCDAKSPSRNSASRFSEATQAYVDMRKEIEKEQTQRELAIKNLADKLATSTGLYKTEEKQADGSTIYYAHNKPTLGESDIVWKFTAEAIGISNDGGKTWPYGFTVTGQMITKILQTEGINASWINTGELVIKDEKGNVTFRADTKTGKVDIVADTFTIKGKTVEEIALTGSVSVSDNPPEDTGRIWCDTTEDPPVFKKYNGETWIIINDQQAVVEQIYKDISDQIATSEDNLFIKIGDKVYSKEEVDKIILDTNTSFEKDKNAFQMNFDQFVMDMDEFKNGTEESFKEQRKYIRFEDGAIVIGIVGNPLLLKQKNDRISFFDNNVEVAYISNRRMYFQDAEILHALILGEFSLTYRAEIKHLTLRFGR